MTQSARDAALRQPTRRSTGQWLQKAQPPWQMGHDRSRALGLTTAVVRCVSSEARAQMSPWFPPRASAGVFYFREFCLINGATFNTSLTKPPRGGGPFLQHSKDGKFSTREFPLEVIYMFYI